MNDTESAVVSLKLCHTEAGSQVVSEGVEAEQLSPSRYRLLYSPGVVEGAAKDDVIELSETDPKGFTVVRRSGFLCVWFYFEEPGTNRGPDGQRVRDAVERFGGVCDGGGNTHLIFSIRVSFGFPAIEKLFNDLAAERPGSSWLYGNVYDPWNDFEPLRWWGEFS